MVHMMDRWMYRGGHPNRLARVLNRAGTSISSVGVVPRFVTLEVPGRRSGRVVEVPLVVADHAGECYLVAMLGERTQWVHNVRAAGGRVVLHHGQRQAVRLVEVEPALRAPILRRYLEVAPGARAHIPVVRHEPVEAFEPVAADFPVFRVVGRVRHPG
jgi:deazaflavin-dependent oxidoreductase (nitroreductase family)